MKYIPILLALCLCACNQVHQKSPLSDENCSRETPDRTVADSSRELLDITGEVRLGHEVRSFKPNGSSKEYWLVDKTGILTDIYNKKTGGEKNNKPVIMTLRVEYDGTWDDGFAADYDGVYLVHGIIQ